MLPDTSVATFVAVVGEVMATKGLTASLLERLAAPAQRYVASLPVVEGVAQSPMLLAQHFFAGFLW